MYNVINCVISYGEGAVWVKGRCLWQNEIMYRSLHPGINLQCTAVGTGILSRILIKDLFFFMGVGRALMGTQIPDHIS